MSIIDNLDKMESMEKSAFAMVEQATKEKSYYVTDEFISDVVKKQLSSKFGFYLLQVVLSSALTGVILTSDISSNWHWIAGIVSVLFTVFITVGVYFYIRISLSVVATLSIILPEMFSKIEAAKIFIENAKDQGINMDDVEKRLKEEEDRYLTSVKNMFDGSSRKNKKDKESVTDMAANVVRKHEEIMEYAIEVSSLSFLRSMSKGITDFFSSVGVPNIEELSNNPDNDYYLENILSENQDRLDIPHDSIVKLDIDMVRATFLRKNSLEDIAKL